MRYLWGTERRRATTRAALLALFVLVPATPARAHGVTASIAPPPTPVVEDSSAQGAFATAGARM